MMAQSDWLVPLEAQELLSIKEFDEEFAIEGSLIYENSCISCHGSPSMSNYSLMVPAPGDPAEERFQIQNDGDLLYKIQKGRGTMPGFENSLSENEIWSLVAYIRSFNPDYKQERPNMEGVEIPVYDLSMTYDENVDKLVVKLVSDSVPVAEASVSAFIQGMFGNHQLGKVQTNELGIAYFDIDSKIPGDSLGFITITTKASKGYGSTTLTQKLAAAFPTKHRSAIEGRHLWSVSKNAPIWLKLAFMLVIIIIWGTIVYVVFGLRKLRA